MTRLILDVDTGIDDALALAYLATFDTVDVLGVIGTYGNVATFTFTGLTPGQRYVVSYDDTTVENSACSRFQRRIFSSLASSLPREVNS